ncbi:MAG: hypothetical protein RUMPE_00958 [Eubacteriales bacterium SKADARSKE-1]|nr:hypothetical protein [Eubacteriales bacterium SKADARSKE-1]
MPKTSRYGVIGLKELLIAIHQKWENDRISLLMSADEITASLKRTSVAEPGADIRLIDLAVALYKRDYDEKFGGFGISPKFPVAHNLLFLLTHYEKSGDRDSLKMAEMTLLQMYSGGLFDHIGYGFCRYSTDRYFLVPHFEKMLYDNALLIIAYCKAYQITKKPVYKDVVQKTASYVLREMTSSKGGFFTAQDADSEGEEGKYYFFEPSEIISLLGEKVGKSFNNYYGITKEGNFKGKSIPNLLQNNAVEDKFDEHLTKLYEYRRQRSKLYLDDKILTSWNSFMITAMCYLYRVSRNTKYLNAAKKAEKFIEENLCDDDTLFVSFRAGRHGEKGFLDEYADYIYSLLALYDATLNMSFLEKAQRFYKKAISKFYDMEQGGFYLYGKGNETLILRPKETYDGAIPSGNSIMTYNLVHLFYLTKDEEIEKILKRQIDFMCGEARNYPAGYAMFLVALSDYFEPLQDITVVLKNKEDAKDLPFITPLESIVRVFYKPTDEYPIKDEKTTFYVCQNHSCMPPVNDLKGMDKSSER